MLAACVLGLGSFAVYCNGQQIRNAKIDIKSEILNDTLGVDFRPYISTLERSTWNAWLAVVPVVALPPQCKQGRVGIRLRIDRLGRVGHVTLEQPSGDASLDQAAWDGVGGALPYAPLPAQFTGTFLELRLIFVYNRPESKRSPAPMQGPVGSP